MKKLIVLILYLSPGIFAVMFLVGMYPKFIEIIISYYHLPNDPEDSPATIRGTFGDMYGALNSFLSGLAVLGIVLTLYWETSLRKDEKKAKEEEENEKEILKLKYFSNLVNGSYIASEDMKKRFSVMANGQQDNSDLPQWSIDAKFELIRTINKKINQEEYFLVFKKHLGDSKILHIYSSCAFIEMVEENLKKRYDLQVEKLNKRKEEFRNLCQSIVEKFDTIYVGGKDSPKTQLDKIRQDLFYYFTQDSSLENIGNWLEGELKKISISSSIEKDFEIIHSRINANIDINTTFLKEFNDASKQLDTSNALLKKELDRLISHLDLKLDEPDKNRGNGNIRIKFKDMINDLIQKIKLKISSKGSLIVLITVLIISLFLLGGLDKASQFGSFFGGIVGPIVTACTGGLLYLSLMEQQFTNKLSIDGRRYDTIMTEIDVISSNYYTNLNTIMTLNNKYFSHSDYEKVLPFLLSIETVILEAKELMNFSSIPIRKISNLLYFNPNGIKLLDTLDKLLLKLDSDLNGNISEVNIKSLKRCIQNIRLNIEIDN